MDTGEEQKHDSSSNDEDLLWLAAVLVGTILIIMITAIVIIALCKCLKKTNNTNQNWAGPPPLADDSVPVRNMFKQDETTSPAKSLSNSYMASVTFGHSQILQDSNDMPNELPEKNMGDELSDTEQVKAGMTCITNPLAKATLENRTLSSAPLIQESNQPFDMMAEDNSNLPPPPDHFMACSITLADNFSNFHLNEPSQDNTSPSPPNLESGFNPQTEHLHNSSEIQDLHLPPPPPEFQ